MITICIWLRCMGEARESVSRTLRQFAICLRHSEWLRVSNTAVHTEMHVSQMDSLRHETSWHHDKYTLQHVLS